MVDKQRTLPELLAPAGDMERLKMAVLYGADAVYLAGTDFGMRAFAGNFDYTLTGGTDMDASNMDVTIDHIAKGGGKLKAFATVTFDGMFRVHGIRLAESKQGLNIFMPQKAFNKNGKTLYTDVFHPITSGARAALKEAVIDAYRKAAK